MNIKEKPFIDAVSRLGPLPPFLFSNPIFGGFFAMVMLAVFGAVFVTFLALGHGVGDALELFELARWGAIAGLILGAIIFLWIAVRAFFESEETKVHLLFVFGGVLGIASLAIVDRLALETLRGWLATVGPIQPSA